MQKNQSTVQALFEKFMVVWEHGEHSEYINKSACYHKQKRVIRYRCSSRGGHAMTAFVHEM